MELLILTEEQYFNMSKEDRYKSAEILLNEMKKENFILPEIFDEVIFQVLNNHLKVEQEKENYMICEAINNMLKIIENG